MNMRRVVWLVLGVFLATNGLALQLAWARDLSGSPRSDHGVGYRNLPERETTWLGKIRVNGHEIPHMVVLGLIKAGLARTWSSAPQDRNLVVCKFHYPLGSHLRNRALLFCETNGQHFLYQNETFYNYPASFRGVVQEFLPRVHHFDPAALRRLLAKLPPVDSKYVIEVRQQGRIVSEWFMNQGTLVKVIHFKKSGESRVVE